VNSRLAAQLAKAFAGSCAFVCAGTLLQVGLPQALGHRGGEDPFHPGDGRA
jgi:hypothetical protein